MISFTLMLVDLRSIEALLRRRWFISPWGVVPSIDLVLL